MIAEGRARAGAGLSPKRLSPLPQGWSWTTLGDIADLVGGGTPSRRDPEHFRGTVIWITPTEIPRGRIGVVADSKERISEEGVRRSSARLIPKGSVLLTTRASIGHVAIAGDEMTTNQGFASFICRDGVYNWYLAYWLWSESGPLNQSATGTTFKEISKSKLRPWMIPLAPLPEQRRIVAKLDELLSQLDAGVAALTRAEANLKRYKVSVLQAACEGRLVPQDPSDEPAGDLLERIVAERREKWAAGVAARGKDPGKVEYVEPPAPNIAELPELPTGWSWVTVSSILAEPMMNGKSVRSSEEGFPVLRLTCLRDGQVDFDEVKTGALTEEQATAYIVKDGDFLVSRGNGSIRLVGRAGLVHKAPRPVAFPDLLIRLRVEPRACSGEFLSAIWDSRLIRSQIEQTARTTAGIFKINQQDIGRFYIPLPPLNEQRRIVAEVEQRRAMIEVTRLSAGANLVRAARLRQSALHCAFEGRLVPQDPNDEPAGILLGRIDASRDRKPREAPVARVRFRPRRLS